MLSTVLSSTANRLVDEGAEVVVYDPAAMENAGKIFGNSVEYASSAIECLEDAECALVVTGWDEFKKLRPDDFIKRMKIPAVVDGRRIYDPAFYSPKLRFAAIGLGSKRYLNPALAINAIIIRDGKILLVRRSIEPYKDEWCLPGGFVEYDERAEEALIREVGEETGLKIKPKKIFNVYSNPLRSPIKHVVSLCYEAEIMGGSLKPGEECSDVKFFPIDELPSKLAFDHLKIIRDYASRF